jgi:hypothetical protein
MDHVRRRVKLSCDANDILQVFEYKIDDDTSSNEVANFKLMPEFGDWMIEAVPAEPYTSYLNPDALLSC